MYFTSTRRNNAARSSNSASEIGCSERSNLSSDSATVLFLPRLGTKDAPLHRSIT
jgi:hypothetical protein